MSRAAVQNQTFVGHQGSYPPAMKQPPPAVQKPSRLLQMRDDYQRRLLKEKEEKMVNMYEDNHRKNLERVERVARGSDVSMAAYPNSKLRQPGHMQPKSNPSLGQMGSTPSVRDFFRERREMEAKGGYVPPISQHYKSSKSRTGSGNSYHKNSAGVDRAQPLAPIQPRNNGVSSAPSQHAPFNNKPRLAGKPAPSLSPDTDENDNYKPAQPQRGGPKNKASPAAARGGGGAGRGSRPSPKEEKLSDFQKWQNEQNKAREDRLKKLNMRAPPSARESAVGLEYEDEDGDDGQNEEIQRKQQELMERIAHQQAELDRLRREREEEEELKEEPVETERQEAEALRKREAAERERRRRQQQEEARQRREEEARARREEEEERRAARAKQERQRYESHLDRYENVNDYDDGSSQPTTHRSVGSRRVVASSVDQATPRSDYSPRPPPSDAPTPRKQAPPPQPKRQPQPPPPAQRRSKPQPQHQQEEEEVPIVPGPGSDFYAQAALEVDNPGRIKLVPCKLCGRKFADDRLAKHQAACKNAQKKRKVFDPTQMRTDGTDMAKYVKKGAHKKEPQKKKKADWRRQHEEFINNIRYAKQMQQMEQQGVSAKDLPPPPPSHNPDLVPCPHCGRTFNDLAAERHIPRCQSLKTRPAANKRR